MVKEFNLFKKDIKKLSKQLNSNKGLMLKKSFDISTSFYGRGKENKPCVTLNTKGDFKISVLKLIVILIFVFSTFALTMFCVKRIVNYCRLRNLYRIKHREKNNDESWI